MKNLCLTFGDSRNPIIKQLSRQGLGLRVDDVNYFQSSADAITRLRLRGYLSESETISIGKKLAKDISENAIKNGK